MCDICAKAKLGQLQRIKDEVREEMEQHGMDPTDVAKHNLFVARRLVNLAMLHVAEVRPDLDIVGVGEEVVNFIVEILGTTQIDAEPVVGGEFFDQVH